MFHGRSMRYICIYCIFISQLLLRTLNSTHAPPGQKYGASIESLSRTKNSQAIVSISRNQFEIIPKNSIAKSRKLSPLSDSDAFSRTSWNPESMLWGDISGGMMRFDEIFKNGLHARYTYKSWNQEWKTWGDVSGNNRDGKASGSGFSSGCDRNQNGWDGVVCSVRGNVNSRVTFGDGSIPPTFTICSVSRYNGPSRGRILNGDSNWLHGHWAGYVGVAYYEGWKTPVPSTSTPQLDWLLFCGQNAPPNIFLANGRAVSNGAGGGRSNIAFGINSLGCCGVSEASDWAVAEVAVWSRALDAQEMALLSAHYKTHIVFYSS